MLFVQLCILTLIIPVLRSPSPDRSTRPQAFSFAHALLQGYSSLLRFTCGSEATGNQSELGVGGGERGRDGEGEEAPGCRKL